MTQKTAESTAYIDADPPKRLPFISIVLKLKANILIDAAPASTTAKLVLCIVFLLLCLIKCCQEERHAIVPVWVCLANGKYYLEKKSVLFARTQLMPHVYFQHFIPQQIFF